MAQLFIARQLETLLQFWEDHNLCGEFNFQVKEKHMRDGGKPLKDSKYVAMIGSELSRDGYLAKPIEDYHMLRKVLGGIQYTHKNNFQPRIPKELRQYFPTGYKNFLNYAANKVSVKISNFLMAWNETKRACIVDQSVVVPRIKLNEEEWLSCLPYRSFYLKLNLGVSYEDAAKSQVWVSNVLVYEEDDMVNMLAWPDSIEQNCLSGEDRKTIMEASVALKKGKKINPNTVELTGKVYREFSILISIKKGTSLLKSVIHNGVVTYDDMYDEEFTIAPEGATSLQKEHYSKQHENFLAIAETVNGFCRVVASLPSGPQVKVIEGDHSHPTQQQPRQWFELPQQVVESFHTKKEDKTVIIRTCGGEVSPHWRRGHYRHFRNGLRIWISDIIVREDLLEKQILQGGALKIK